MDAHESLCPACLMNIVSYRRPLHFLRSVMETGLRLESGASSDSSTFLSVRGSYRSIKEPTSARASDMDLLV